MPRKSVKYNKNMNLNEKKRSINKSDSNNNNSRTSRSKNIQSNSKNSLQVAMTPPSSESEELTNEGSEGGDFKKKLAKLNRDLEKLGFNYNLNVGPALFFSLLDTFLFVSSLLSFWCLFLF